MRARGAMIAASGAALLACGCSLLGDGAATDPPTHAEITPAEDTPWATDVWLPGASFDASWPLAVSASGDVLMEYTDDAASWADGVGDGETGLAIVSPDGDVEYLASPGDGPIADSAFFAQISESTVALLDGYANETEAAAMWLIDRDTGDVTTVPATLTDGPLAGAEVSPAPDFLLMRDTVLWIDHIEGAAETLEPVAANSSGHVRLALESSPKVAWLSEDQCGGGEILSIAGFYSDRDPFEITYLEGTLDDSGQLSVRQESSFTLDPERDGAALVHGVARCGDSIVGVAQGSMSDRGAEYVLATAEGLTQVSTGISAEGLPIASFLTEQWIAVATDGPVLSSRTSIVKRSTGEQWNPGGESPCGGSLKVSGRTILWAEPVTDWSESEPVVGQCVTYVGTLRTD